MSDDLDELEQELEDGARRRRVLTPVEWAQVKALWELGSVTLAELEERFGIRADSIQRRLKAEGVVKGAKAFEAGRAVESQVKTQAEETIRRIGETKEQHYQYAEAIAKLTMQAVLDARRNNNRLASIDGDLAALNKAMKTLEAARKERWAVLGLDKDDAADPEDLPELLVSELTSEQIEKIRDNMRSGEVDLAGIDDIVETGG